MADGKKKSQEMKDTLNDLSTRVSAAREANEPKEAHRHKEATAYGIATRLIAELLAGPLVGAFLGWYLDQLFDTKPWLMIVLIMTGVAAGIMNVMRASKQLAPKNMDNEDDEK